MNTRPDRIVIPLTQGNINNGHVYLARHLDFFPDDAIGGPNKQAGQGTPLTLHFEGFPGPNQPTSLPIRKASGAAGTGRSSLSDTVFAQATRLPSSGCPRTSIALSPYAQHKA